MAEYDDRVVAAITAYRVRDYCELLFIGTDESYLDVRPNHAVYRRAIEWAAEEGMALVDLGGAPAEHSLGKFKAQWAAQEVPEYRYDHVVATGGDGPQGSRADSVRGATEGLGGKRPLVVAAWNRMPLAADQAGWPTGPPLRLSRSRTRQVQIQAGMADVALVAHAQPLSDGHGGPIGGGDQGDEPLPTQMPARGLDRCRSTPVASPRPQNGRRSVHPDLDLVRQLGHESGWEGPIQPATRPLARSGRPTGRIRARASAACVLESRERQFGVRRATGHQSPRDLGIRPDGRERVGIVLSPPSKQQPLGLDVLRELHRRRYSARGSAFAARRTSSIVTARAASRLVASMTGAPCARARSTRWSWSLRICSKRRR